MAAGRVAVTALIPVVLELTAAPGTQPRVQLAVLRALAVLFTGSARYCFHNRELLRAVPAWQRWMLRLCVAVEVGDEGAVFVPVAANAPLGVT